MRDLTDIEIQNLENYRVHTFYSRVILSDLPGNRITTKAVSDGYWIFLLPLSIGKHKIEFAGEKLAFDEITNFNSDHLPKFNTEVAYDITIV